MKISIIKPDNVRRVKNDFLGGRFLIPICRRFIWPKNKKNRFKLLRSTLTSTCDQLGGGGGGVCVCWGGGGGIKFCKE